MMTNMTCSLLCDVRLTPRDYEVIEILERYDLFERCYRAFERYAMFQMLGRYFPGEPLWECTVELQKKHGVSPHRVWIPQVLCSDWRRDFLDYIDNALKEEKDAVY